MSDSIHHSQRDHPTDSRPGDGPAHYVIRGGGYRAEVSEVGAAVRELVYDDPSGPYRLVESGPADLVFDTRIRKTVRYAEAPVQGSSVLKYDPSGSAAEAYRDLAKEVLNGAKAREHA